MNGLQRNETYDNPSRSPRGSSYQTQSLHRQPSRPVDNFGQASNGLYTINDVSAGYDGQRYNERMTSTLPHGYGGFDMGMSPAWNSSGFGQNSSFNGLGGGSRAKAPMRGRGPLPHMWLEQPQPMQPQNQFAGFNGPMNLAPMRPEQLNVDGDDDLIPTAIVIKNIPFAVKKEQLVSVMNDMGLPIPYAFNYHFDSGIFRGLAFANFTTPDETAAVIAGMNHLELQGRKLRVEYKKMLPQAERDRIEREKRERRGQLEEQHRPTAPSQLQNQASMSSLSSHLQGHSPSPNSARIPQPSMFPGRDMSAARMNGADIDMNDHDTLGYYSKLILFQGDPSQGDVLPFPPDIPADHRKIIHGLAHQLGLSHTSHGAGDQRQVHVYRDPNGNSPHLSSNAYALDPNRRHLSRAATTDFSNVRSNETNYGGPATNSASFLGFPETHGGLSVGSNLRNAKSFADLRSYTPSPAHSVSSFPAGLTGNLQRFQEYGPPSPGSTRSNLTPTTSNMQNGPDSLLNGMSGMNLNNSAFGQPGSSPHRLRGMVSWDREVSNAGPGPIGGHRAFSATHDDTLRSRNQNGPMRQPRKPFPGGSGAFPRSRNDGHQTRGSDELSSPSAAEINAS
ncbi:MAG: hypothetical protein M1828_002306 [Chrysothrix sp. TS-e1954]|nr:MAG: hypothetical protein M1828_002306 [Chrysothrix sp. TS-e1954]